MRSIKNQIIRNTDVAISEASPCFQFRMSILNITIPRPMLENGPRLPIQDAIHECLKCIKPHM
jgi:hypothetical protein